MRNINKVILIGNIARAPEVRVTNGGQKMATFILATNRTWYDPTRQKQSQAEFHNMLSWGKIAEICERFLQKSTLVYVEGYLKTRSWDGDDGQRFYRTEIVVQDILVLDRGIRHEKGTMGQSEQQEDDASFFDNNESSSYDFEDDFIGDDDGSEKAPSAIEKSFQDKLSAGNDMHADTKRSDVPAAEPSDSKVSLNEPLFEEETR